MRKVVVGHDSTCGFVDGCFENVKKMRIMANAPVPNFDDKTNLLDEVKILTRWLVERNMPVVDPNVLFEKLESVYHMQNRLNVVFYDICATINNQPSLLEQSYTNGQALLPVNCTAPQNYVMLANGPVVTTYVKTPASTFTIPVVSTFTTPVVATTSKAHTSTFDTRVIDLTKENETDRDIRANVVQMTKDLVRKPETIVAPQRFQEKNEIEVVMPNEVEVRESWQKLKDIFHDADPDYLYQIVQQNYGKPEQLQETVNHLLESRNYPRLTEALKTRSKEALKRKYLDRNFPVEAFLEMFDDPVQYFNDYQRPKSENYKTHTWIILCNWFPKICDAEIQRVTSLYNYSLTRSYRELHAIENNPEPPSKRKKHNPSATIKGRPARPLPEEPDEMFYKELKFLKLEKEIEDYKLLQKVTRDSKIHMAAANKELVTCCCCYDDEVLLEEILMCDNGHIFCMACIRKSTEVNIGQDILKFPCLYADCKKEFPLPVLQKALRPLTFSKLLQKIQEAEIKEANIPDLVSCPFCSYCAIISNPEDKIFKCQNPECMKETCRFCKELDHLPLRCEENESSKQTNMRTYIENKMTNALLRTCPKCQRSFVKEFGCNKMICQCGAVMCYVCRKLIKGYDHFKNSRCPQFSDDYDVHDAPVNEVAAKAKEEFLANHPELGQVQLKYDPTKGLKKKKTQPPPNQDYPQWFDNSDSEDDDVDSFDEDASFSDSFDDDDYFEPEDQEDLNDNSYNDEDALLSTDDQSHDNYDETQSVHSEEDVNSVGENFDDEHDETQSLNSTNSGDHDLNDTDNNSLAHDEESYHTCSSEGSPASFKNYESDENKFSDNNDSSDNGGEEDSFVDLNHGEHSLSDSNEEGSDLQNQFTNSDDFSDNSDSQTDIDF